MLSQAGIPCSWRAREPTAENNVSHFQTFRRLWFKPLTTAKTPRRQKCHLGVLVEATGFEPTTSWSRTKRATKLRYASNDGYYIKPGVLWQAILSRCSKNPARRERECDLKTIRDGPVSRVLSSAVIYLRPPSPAGSSVIHGSRAQALFTALLGRAAHKNRAQTCIGRGLHGTGRYRPVGELLPRLSILTAPRKALRSISVALSLKSPSPDVIRRPAL